ncbi:protein NUCLEAR FUSION DEFECTIVE 4-like [Rhodamnia argentea]|uniref:Protein NUCLEAR FUSION DEFECTIVE 4-like n=1 Tax=Rhodamnia argentea TaxID=178133 RepID=A0ABM3HU59_9MYRT|nr:protein NUCLEAR FUSION DEFECTIVE 4-like [Rhodamnia argentea]
MPPSLARWLSLVALIWLQTIAGTNTNFPAYSSQLKQMLNISQVQLNNLAFASDAGKLLGWFSGLAAAHLPLWLVLLVGALLGLVGNGVQYLFVAGKVASVSYPGMFLLAVLAGNSICWINTVCYVVAIRNFPLHRQVAIGLTTSYQGLSASFYTDVVDAATRHAGTGARAEAYLLLNSVLPMAVSLATAPFVRVVNADGPGAGKNAHGGFIILFIITIATGIFAVVSSMGSVSGAIPAVYNAMGMGIFLLIPIIIPLAEGVKHVLAHNEKRVHDIVVTEQENGKHGGDEGGLQWEAHPQVGNQEEAVAVVPTGEEVAINSAREEVGARAMVTRVEFWLYFFVYLFGATLGIVFLNNLGQIAESRGTSKTPSLVSLSSSFGFFGRLIPSLFDYLFERRRYVVSRPAAMAALMAPMVGAYFLLLNHAPAALYVSTAIIGVCTGAITSISVSTTTELFGTKNFGVNHNVVVTNIPIGSFVFGYGAALLYRRRRGGDAKCMGMDCYSTTFVVWGSLCLLGTALALVLHARTRKFYSRNIER